MRNELILDAVQAEVAYRTEELYKAGRTAQRPWRFGRRAAEPVVPEQRRPRHDRVTPSRAAR
jgi:hypothetical protein